MSAEGEEIVKKGTLEKLGGGEGGRQNWKTRYFVYKTKALEYYESESAYNKGTKYKGRITLDCYYAAKTDTKGKPEFCVYAYPKNMTCRADDETTMQEWIDVLNLPGREDTDI